MQLEAGRPVPQSNAEFACFLPGVSVEQARTRASPETPLDSLQETPLLCRPLDYLGDERWRNQPTCYKARSIC